MNTGIEKMAKFKKTRKYIHHQKLESHNITADILVYQKFEESSQRLAEKWLKIHLTPVLGNPREWGCIVKRDLCS